MFATSSTTQLVSNSYVSHHSSVNMDRVAAVILGGGKGNRLFPLTMTRCKPAICFGGRYRLIDVPVSNAIHSGCRKIFIITQYLSSSLHRYISQTYNQGNLSSGFIDVLSAEERHSKQVWFQGTADAVRQNMMHFMETSADYFLILSGDQLYHMDFSDMIRVAIDTNADALVAALPVTEKDASRMGILQIDERFFVTDFFEKPKDKKILSELITPYLQLQSLGIAASANRNYLASMGIYLFKREVLFDLLLSDHRHDFGSHLIPSLVEKGSISAYLHDGYWEDIGTISSFYEANISLTKQDAPFSCYSETRPIFSSRSSVPGAKISKATISDSIICEGSILDECEISSSIIGLRSKIQQGTKISDSYLMGNDFYESPIKNPSNTGLVIGKNCEIQRAILDKNVSLGNNVRLTNEKQIQEYDGEGIYIRDGIIVVTRGTRLPDHFTL